MAYVAPNGQDPNQQNQQGTGSQGTISGTSGGVMSGGGSSAYQAPNAPRSNPSGTPNIQDYLNANPNAGQHLASAVTQYGQNQANTLNQQYNTSQQQLNNLYTPINQTISQGQSAANTAFQNPTDLLNAYQTAQTQANPTPGTSAAAPNQQNLNAYNAFEGNIPGTQQYNQQQQQIQNYNQAGQQVLNNLQPQANQLQQQANLATNQMGQSQLLQNTVGTPNYTPGQQTLDSLFLSGQGNQLYQNLNNIANTANTQVSGLGTNYQNKLAALQQLAGQNTAYTQNLFLNGPSTNSQQGTGLNQIAANVNQEYAGAQAAQPEQVNTFNASANAAGSGTSAHPYGQFTATQLNQLGLPGSEQAWGVNLSPYIHATTLQPQSAGGNAQVASADEFARYNALNQLAGGTSGSVQPSIFGTSTTASGFNPVSFDASAFQQAVQQQKQALTSSDLQNQFANINPQISAAYGVEAPNIIGNINSMLKAGTDPNQILTALTNPTYENQLANSYTNYLANQGWNTGFAGMASNAYNQALQPFETWLKNTYNPAANDILGNKPVQTSGPQGGLTGAPTLTIPGTYGTSWQGGSGGL